MSFCLNGETTVWADCGNGMHLQKRVTATLQSQRLVVMSGVFFGGFSKRRFFAKRHLAFGKQPAITTNTEMMKYWNRDNTGSDKASTTQQPSCQHLCYHNTLGGSQQDIHSTRVTSRSSMFASSTKRQLFHSLPAWRTKTLGSVRRRRWS